MLGVDNTHKGKSSLTPSQVCWKKVTE